MKEDRQVSGNKSHRTLKQNLQPEVLRYLLLTQTFNLFVMRIAVFTIAFNILTGMHAVTLRNLSSLAMSFLYLLLSLLLQPHPQQQPAFVLS